MPAALALVALMIVFALVRPALKAAAGAAPARDARLHVVADEPLRRPGPAPALEAPRSNEHLEGARAIAKQNPAAVAGIVREWVNGEAS
jgi:flagellar M-ring protein FliF